MMGSSSMWTRWWSRRFAIVRSTGGLRARMRAYLDGARIPLRLDVGFGDALVPDPPSPPDADAARYARAGSAGIRARDGGGGETASPDRPRLDQQSAQGLLRLVVHREPRASRRGCDAVFPRWSSASMSAGTGELRTRVGAHGRCRHAGVSDQEELDGGVQSVGGREASCARSSFGRTSCRSNSWSGILTGRYVPAGESGGDASSSPVPCPNVPPMIVARK